MLVGSTGSATNDYRPSGATARRLALTGITASAPDQGLPQGQSARGNLPTFLASSQQQAHGCRWLLDDETVHPEWRRGEWVAHGQSRIELGL